MTRDDIFEEVKAILVELFEVEPEQVILEANLYEDLDIDSIDAVDMMVKLRALTGKKIDPEAYKKIRTVHDTVDAIVELLKP